jgi:hypothetical protein
LYQRSKKESNDGFKAKATLLLNTKWLILLAAPSGFEPKTYRLGGGCSIQLSYGAKDAVLSAEG